MWHWKKFVTRFLKVCLSTLIIAFTLFPFKSEAVTHVSWIGELNQTHDIMQMLFRKNWLFFKLNVGYFWCHSVGFSCAEWQPNLFWLNQETSFQQNSFKLCWRWHRQQKKSWSLGCSMVNFLNLGQLSGSWKPWLTFHSLSNDWKRCFSCVLFRRRSLLQKSRLRSWR